MRVFSDASQAIHLGAGETFAMVLACNPSTGFLWEPSFDARYLELVSRKFRQEGQRIGAGAEEMFHLRALQAGETQILFELRRSWETEAGEMKLFRITID